MQAVDVGAVVQPGDLFNTALRNPDLLEVPSAFETPDLCDFLSYDYQRREVGEGRHRLETARGEKVSRTQMPQG